MRVLSIQDHTYKRTHQDNKDKQGEEQMRAGRAAQTDNSSQSVQGPVINLQPAQAHLNQLTVNSNTCLCVYL